MGLLLTKLEFSTQVKAVHEENVKRTYDPVLDEKHGVTNTEEVHRFELYFTEFEVRRFVEFDKKPISVFDGWWKI